MLISLEYKHGGQEVKTVDAEGAHTDRTHTERSQPSLWIILANYMFLFAGFNIIIINIYYLKQRNY